MGGSSKWPDYCPLWEGDQSLYCKDGSAQAGVQNKGYGEAHTSIAACFDVNVPGYGADAGCFEKQCITDTSGNKQLTVKVGNNVFTCVDNTAITITGTPAGTFTLTCPPVEFFCADQFTQSNSAVPWTYNPSDSQPIPPKNPFGGGPGSAGGSTDPALQLVWGSTLVWILLALGILLALIIFVALCCVCCNRSNDDGGEDHIIVATYNPTPKY